jgi:hypothetical protein
MLVQRARCASAIVASFVIASPSVLGARESISPVAQRTSCSITGEWAGRKAIRVGDVFKVFSLYAFRFGADGSYSYVVGDEGGIAASHSGTFVTSEATDAGGRRYPCLLTLQPARDTVRRVPNKSVDGAPLGFEDFSQGEPVTFRVRAGTNPGDLSLIYTSVTGRDFQNDIGSFRLSRTP